LTDFIARCPAPRRLADPPAGKRAQPTTVEHDSDIMGRRVHGSLTGHAFHKWKQTGTTLRGKYACLTALP
jgi:hypothetical protein